jgi:hypothetical protein
MVENKLNWCDWGAAFTPLHRASVVDAEKFQAARLSQIEAA